MANIDVSSKKFKPTLKDEPTEQGEKFEKNFDATMNRNDVDLNEIDQHLTEKKQSIKKQIWDLAKMEALVHSDQKLSAIYNEMSEDGEEKYGYHYNETIMNIIFNEYVLNSVKYLEKYRAAIPVEKKRRDKSGINQLQDKADEKKAKDNDSKEKKSDMDEAIQGTYYNLVKDNGNNKLLRKTVDGQDSYYVGQDVDAFEAGGQPQMPYKAFNDFQSADAAFAAMEENNTTHNNSLEGIQSDDIDETTGAASAGAFAAPMGYKPKKMMEDYEEDFTDEENGDTIVWEVIKNIDDMYMVKGTNTTNGVPVYLVGKDVYKLADDYPDVPQLPYKHHLDKQEAMLDFAHRTQVGALNEKAESKAQQRLMGQAYAYKKGELKDASKKVKELADSMSMEDLKDFASTKHDDLPEKVDEEKEEMDETTTSSSSGAYETPYAFAKGKSRFAKKPAYPDGEIIDESESYLTDPETFRILFESLQEDEDPCWDGYEQVGMKKKDGKEVPNCVPVDEQINEHHKHTKEDKIDFIVKNSSHKKDELDSKSEDEVNKIYNDIEDKVINENPLVGAAVRGLATGAAMSAMDEEDGGGRSMLGTLADRIEQILGGKRLEDLSPEQQMSIIMQASKQMEDEVRHFNESIIDDQPDSMAAHMAGGGGAPMMEEKPKADDNNPLKDFGSSDHGVGGFDGVGDPQESIKYKDNSTNFVNKRKEAFNESADCRKDELPNPDKKSEDDPNCVKKDTYYDKKKEMKSKKTGKPKEDDSKFNLEARKEREKQYKNKLKQKEMEFDKELKEAADLMESLKKISQGETVSEDKKPSALVLKDRLGKENEANFKKDLKDSNSAEIAANQGEAERADDQYTEVDDPQKLSKDIEKDKLSQHDYESFDNEGDSTNDTNDEIPKRNRTEEEQKEVALNRGYGMEALDYDLEPSERFKERAKKDMGEDIYELGQEKVKARDGQIHYEKDEQPTEDESSYKKKHMREGVMTGKYRDAKNTTQFVNFDVANIEKVDSIDESYTKLSLDGLGNVYTQRIDENHNMRTFMDNFDIYFNQEKVVAVSKGNTTKVLMEGDEKKKQPVNESFEKMKKLWGYKPSNYINTQNVKKNAKF